MFNLRALSLACNLGTWSVMQTGSETTITVLMLDNIALSFLLPAFLSILSIRRQVTELIRNFKKWLSINKQKY